MVKLTEKETQLVNAMRSNEYNDALADGCTWTFTAIDNSGLGGQVARGVISSLVQKGLVFVEIGDKKAGDEDTIGFTKEGKKLFDNADGEDCPWGGLKLLAVKKAVVNKPTETVEVVAFTGMKIGTFKIASETKDAIKIKTASGLEMIFNKSTGVQTNAKNPRFASRIVKEAK